MEGSSPEKLLTAAIAVDRGRERGTRFLRRKGTGVEGDAACLG